MGINTRFEVMAKEVSALNTYWLLQYLQERHPRLDLEDLIAQISQMFPCYVENLKTGQIEQIGLDHLRNPRYWFSHRFVKALHDLIQEHIPDPRLGFKIGSTMYKTQPIIKTALGIPLLGLDRVAQRVSREAAKYNRTKQYQVQKLGKGYVEIRIIHDPGIVISEFTMQWNAGCYFSYARLSGATNITVDLHCIDSGPVSPDDKRRAIWDFVIRYKEPGLFIRLAKAVLFNLPWVKGLTERAEAVEEEHQEQILDRDNIIRQRTAALVRANETMRIEIDERKRAEEALLQSRGKLQRYITAIDDIGLGLCVINADYRLRTMNGTMIGWFGDHIGKTCHKAIMGQDSPCPECRLTDVIEQTKKVRYSFTLADGRSFEIVATPLSNNDGTISKMVIIRNITEQKEQEQRRLEISQHKEQLTKLASLKTMAGAIAHRFNNAMVGVQGNLELLTLVLPGNSREHVMVRHAFQAAKGASQIGSMMLSYVGQQPLTPRELSLVEIAREVVADSKHLFHSAMDLRFFPPADPFYCLIDRRQIKEVIQNILTNAVESLGNGSGTIEITFGIDYFITALFPICFQDSNLEDGRYAFCQIKDSGHGVGAENLSKVFEPFYTSRFFGRGLGLALTVGIMQSHHGAITFESSPGIGTTVRILLPVFETRAEQTNPEIKKPESPQKQLSGDILLVDDESIVLEVGREILTRLGFTVDTAVNGREAVEKVRARGLDYRAIVMDISMPELNGIEAMKAIRKVHPTIPIVLSSGYSEGSFPVNEDERCRPDGFLGKPFQISDMQRNLEILLTGN
jgi:signal transduction histidine kinase/CheY-like chemotaxis protein